MAARFYTPQPLGPGDFVLDGPEGHHLATVRRIVPGERVTLFNGDGSEYPATVVAVAKKSVSLSVGPAVAVDREVGFPLVVASALPKGDRGDYLIEKLSELGATRFVPLATARSVVQPTDAKAEKLERAVVLASKQCGRNVLMTVDPPSRWLAFIARPDLPPLKLVLHTNNAVSIRELPAETIRSGVVVAIGPEGGFDDAEIAAAVTNGWRIVSLGKRVLRVETAGPAAVARLAAAAE